MRAQGLSLPWRKPVHLKELLSSSSFFLLLTHTQVRGVSPPPPSSRPPATPPSPPPGKPAHKKIRVTSSEGKTANLTLEPSVTFSELQAAIERELRCVCVCVCIYSMCKFKALNFELYLTFHLYVTPPSMQHPSRETAPTIRVPPTGAPSLIGPLPPRQPFKRRACVRRRGWSTHS